MINEKMLKAYMAQNGTTQAGLCKEIKMDASTFYRKINGISSFTVLEVESIGNALNIPKSEWQDIFFASSIA